jgi:Glycosyl hydrolase family 47
MRSIHLFPFSLWCGHSSYLSDVWSFPPESLSLLLYIPHHFFSYISPIPPHRHPHSNPPSYLGGLLSTIDLLEHGLGPSPKPSPPDQKGLQKILHQAETLVQKLAPGLSSPTNMWFPRVDFRTGRGVQEDLWGDTSISPARAGTNILEYGRLSELSGDLVYLRNVLPLSSPG